MERIDVVVGNIEIDARQSHTASFITSCVQVTLDRQLKFGKGLFGLVKVTYPHDPWKIYAPGKVSVCQDYGFIGNMLSNTTEHISISINFGVDFRRALRNRWQVRGG